MKNFSSIESLKKQRDHYKAFVHFVSYDYHELSHDKIAWQRDDWKKRAVKCLETGYEMEESQTIDEIRINLLIEAITKTAKKLKIIRDDVEIDGPMALMLCEYIAEIYKERK